MRVLKTGYVLKALLADGWYIAAIKGSHRQLRHPDKPGKVTLNGKLSSDIWGRELDSVEKQAGRKF